MKKTLLNSVQFLIALYGTDSFSETDYVLAKYTKKYAM